MDKPTVYILYSEVHDKYYIGQTRDLEMRLAFHNELPGNRYTSRFRPWKLKMALEFESRGLAMKAEKIIKARKSRQYLKQLIESEEARNVLRTSLDEPPVRAVPPDKGRD
ncbi:MAG: GIY-YIG nuclease family protein [Saprospiraceae bacterium]|nr:GIY-YIG nuclease family protein [Saprospiraceae bacterium]